MYTQALGLRKEPFSLTPDPGFLYLTAQHREALVGLTYAILQRKGFVVMTGEAGTEKPPSWLESCSFCRRRNFNSV